MSAVWDPEASARETGHAHEIPRDVPRIIPIPRVDDAAIDDIFKFTSDHSACRASWGAPVFVEIELDRFADSRDDLTAEVVVRSTAPGLRSQLAQRRLPLLGTRAIADLARYLKDRLKDRIVDWPELLETAFVRAVQAHREGEPAIVLRDVIPSARPEHELKPLALRENLTIAHGKPDQGKSFVAAAVGAVLVTERADILGLHPARTARVLYLDWETDEQTVAKRVRMILGGDPPASFVYVACRGAIWDELDRIKRVARQHQSDYLICDSVGMACGGIPPETSEAALRFGTAYRRIGLGMFAVAHVPHDSDESRPYGSQFWQATLRLGWSVKKTGSLGRGGFSLSLTNTKANNGPDEDPMGYDLLFEGDRVRFQQRSDDDVAESTPQAPIRWRMQQVLREGPLTIVAIADRLDGADVESIARTARRYAGRTFVRQPGPDGVDRWANLARRREA